MSTKQQLGFGGACVQSCKRSVDIDQLFQKLSFPSIGHANLALRANTGLPRKNWETFVQFEFNFGQALHQISSTDPLAQTPTATSKTFSPSTSRWLAPAPPPPPQLSRPPLPTFNRNLKENLVTGTSPPCPPPSNKERETEHPKYPP